MRITNSMMINNILTSLNKNRASLASLEEQKATGKKIQRPSDNPIVAARALKFRTNISEIKQYETNTNDALSWLSVTEQAIKNSTEITKRISELSVQGSSGGLTTKNRESMIEEIKQLRQQLVNEGNVSYAGRHVFTGYQTNKSLVYESADNTENFLITEHLEGSQMETVKRVYGDEIHEASRIRLGYGTINEATVPATIPGYTVIAMSSTDTLSSVPPAANEAYAPGLNEVHFLTDTGELIFNQENVNATSPPVLPGDPELIPTTFDFDYEKDSFKKGDVRPDHYFDSTNLTTGDVFTVTEEAMTYQVSYSQDMQVNVMGYDFITTDLVRDLDEIISATTSISYDESLSDELKQDLLTEQFSSLIGKMDKHIQNNLNVTSLIGGKVNRLELTLNRLSENKLNFNDLLSENEDVDMAETLIKFSAQEVVYNIALSSSSKIIQPTLLDFMR